MANNNVLSIDEVRDGGVCVVAVTGRIDSTNADDLKQKLGSLITAGEKSIVVDLSQLLYLTSLGFRALVIAARDAERNAARFALCGITGHVRDLFEMGGMLEVFTIHPSRQEAVAHNAAGA
jgi:anti-sigma B factor antagonist